MIYDFSDSRIDLLKVFGKGDVAKSDVYDGLSADVGELFSGLL